MMLAGSTWQDVYDNSDDKAMWESQMRKEGCAGYGNSPGAAAG